MPKATEKKKNIKTNAPEASVNRSRAAKRLPGYEWCWCHGFNIGCGLVRLSKTCKRHENKQQQIAKGKYDRITCHIRAQSLTFQFLENQAGLLADFHG